MEKPLYKAKFLIEGECMKFPLLGVCRKGNGMNKIYKRAGVPFYTDWE